MLEVKKKGTRATSSKFVFMSIDVVLVSCFVNFVHISHCLLVFLWLTLKR